MSTETFQLSEEMQKKLNMIRKLGELAQSGIKLSQNYSMSSDYDAMVCEYELHTSIKHKRFAIQEISGTLMHFYVCKGLPTPDVSKYYDLLSELYDHDLEKSFNDEPTHENCQSTLTIDMKRKLKLLRKLGELVHSGTKLSQNYSMNSDYDAMKHEYELQISIKNKQNNVQRINDMAELLSIFKNVKTIKDDMAELLSIFKNDETIKKLPPEEEWYFKQFNEIMYPVACHMFDRYYISLQELYKIELERQQEYKTINKRPYTECSNFDNSNESSESDKQHKKQKSHQ